jgi:nickel-dependent lactate racemase
MNHTLSAAATAGSQVTNDQVAELMGQFLPEADYRGKRILLIIPDGTRTAPVGTMFKAIHRQIGGAVKALDVLIALGTHQPMNDEAICRRLEITPAERQGQYGRVQCFNHEWDNPAALETIGHIPADEISRLSNGQFAMDVPVEINRRVLGYDQLIIIGPVFPHEVVGFSGGNKYLFPGVSGPSVLNFFHWLSAINTNPMTIGQKHTPIRDVINRAADMVKVDKRCLAMVVAGKEFVGLFAGTPENAWSGAADLSRDHNIIQKERPFHTILSVCPPMYEDLWTGGKCMYKLEPVLADGGELIILAPHIEQISVTHGKTLSEIGYHCRDYFLKQWDRFKHRPWGVLAHSTHVRGVGTFNDGVERCRAKVTLASQLTPELCERINLGHRDPASLRKEDFADREAEGVLLVPKAGEMLYQLANPPQWAGGAA